MKIFAKFILQDCDNQKSGESKKFGALREASGLARKGRGRTPHAAMLSALNQLDVGFLPTGHRNRQRFWRNLLSEITYCFQKANIDPHMTEKWMKMGGNVGFLRRLSQNRQRRRPMPFRPYVVIKERSCFFYNIFALNRPHKGDGNS